jgi:HK97 gp10 family phage protein
MTVSTTSWSIKGLAQLDENLRRLSGDVAGKWVNGGLLKGAKVLAAQATANAPDRKGLLRSTIRVTRGSKSGDDNRRDYYVVAGSRKKGGGGAFYAGFVERGTKPHEIKARAGGALVFGGHYASVVQHPGAKATHFMESAARTKANDAVNAYAGYIRAKLDRAGHVQPGHRVMRAEAVVASILSGASAVTAIVGTKITAVQGFQADDAPFVVYWKGGASRSPSITMNGPVIVDAVVNLQFVALDYPTLKNLAEAARLALVGQFGDFAGVHVNKIEAASEGEDVYDPDLALFAQQWQYLITHQE